MEAHGLELFGVHSLPSIIDRWGASHGTPQCIGLCTQAAASGCSRSSRSSSSGGSRHVAGLQVPRPRPYPGPQALASIPPPSPVGTVTACAAEG